MKRSVRILVLALVTVFLFQSSVFSLSNSISVSDDGISTSIVSIESNESNRLIKSQNKDLPFAPSISDFKGETEIIDYIQNGPKAFTAGSDIITIDKLLANSKTIRPAANGDVSGVFYSKRMDTGTPGVTWDYSVNYTISPMPSGTGWYFKSVSCTVYAYKEFLFYTWANAGILTFTSATHSLSPSTRPTSLTINMTLQFEIWTSATGPNSITYSESHSHTTTINNIYS